MTSPTNLYPEIGDRCEECRGELYRFDNTYSKDLMHRKRTSTTPKSVYNAEGKTCMLCGNEVPDERTFETKDIEKENDESSWDNIWNSKLAYVILGIVILLSISHVWPHGPFPDATSKASEKILNTELPKLKQKYPNQKPELWHNVLKITNYTEPLVQVLILLHKGNGEVAECFAKDLVKLINQIINKNGLAIYKEKSKVTEYGEELSHYLNVVRKHNHLIVFQLDKMSGSTARMFHSLCDQAPTSVRPSFFIFTVEDETVDGIEAMRPLTRASHILRSAWSNLMDNELHPLIARVVRNVAEISPENITC